MFFLGHCASLKVNQNVAEFLPFCCLQHVLFCFSRGDPGEWTDPSGPSHDGGDWTEPGSAVGATGAAAEDPTPPWRSQELPPPPKRPSSLSTVKVKRFRRAVPKARGLVLWCLEVFFLDGREGVG